MTTRRDFLRNMTAASMVLPLMSDENASKFLTTDGPQLRVAFCGLGSYANRAADAIQACKNVKATTPNAPIVMSFLGFNWSSRPPIKGETAATVRNKIVGNKAADYTP